MQNLYKFHDFAKKLNFYLKIRRFANIKKKFPRSHGRPQFPKILGKIPRSGNADNLREATECKKKGKKQAQRRQNAIKTLRNT